MQLDDIHEKNAHFLQAFDTSYFRYQLETHIRQLNTPRGLEAAIALRVLYHHALETFLLLLFGNLQALDCIVGYVHRCRPEDLRNIVRKVNRGGDGLYTRMKLPSANWENIANFTVPEYEGPAPSRPDVIARYARLWKAFGRAYISDAAADEYNSLKHGFRAGLGGFVLDLTINLHEKAGTSQLPAIRFGHGDCGTSFFTAEPVPDAPRMHFGLRFNAHNWDPHKLVPTVRLLLDSIDMTLISLKLRNGIGANDLSLPVSDELFTFDDSFNAGAPSSSFFIDHEFSADHIVMATREELLDWIAKSEPKFEALGVVEGRLCDSATCRPATQEPPRASGVRTAPESEPPPDK